MHRLKTVGLGMVTDTVTVTVTATLARLLPNLQVDAVILILSRLYSCRGTICASLPPFLLPPVNARIESSSALPPFFSLNDISSAFLAVHSLSKKPRIRFSSSCCQQRLSGQCKIHHLGVQHEFIPYALQIICAESQGMRPARTKVCNTLTLGSPHENLLCQRQGMTAACCSGPNKKL